ncbi:MAG TPA: citrate synthase [Limnochordia bacterium]
MSATPFKAGLEDVVALTSEICFIDGQEGRLLYRGYDIDDLATEATFEEVVYLLWHGRLPNASELDALKAALAAASPLAPGVLDLLERLPADAPPMDVLRTAVSALPLFPEGKGGGQEGPISDAIRLVAEIPTIVAAQARLAAGKRPLAPRPDLSLAANFLYMLHGTEPDPSSARTFDICLILHADHELNASTFAARVTAATLSDIYAAVTSAIGALKGPLHGGANEQVMRTLLEIGDIERVESWVKEALAAKRRIMGFGHRVYKTEDPRATHLRRLSEQVSRQAGEAKWYEMSRRMEEVVRRLKPNLYPNVDFYSASTYHALGIPTSLFTPVFACSRSAGWTAHILEQYENNRLIRPRAEYTGQQRAVYTPLSRRG